MRWYRKAADQGNADAQYNLGNMYDRGYAAKDDDLVEVTTGESTEQGDADV